MKVKYLFIEAPSSYNLIIGRPTSNRMGATISTLYLCMKYMLPNGRVGIFRVDHEIAIKCYEESLGLMRTHIQDVKVKKSNY